MINHYALGVLASERHNTFLAEAEASPLARSARGYRRRAGTSGARGSSLRCTTALRPQAGTSTPG